jgi:hypothetical protein
MEIIITRNKIEVLPILCVLITIPILKNKRISFRFVLFGILSAIMVVYTIYALWIFRSYGSISDFISKFDFLEFNEIVFAKITENESNGELNYRKWFYYYIQNNNNFKNFNRGHSYIRMLLVYIPTRFSFGVKPPDFAISMGAAIGMDEGGSMHPTLFGDCYANLNVFGIFLGGFWAFYATIVDKIVISQDPKNAVLIYVLNSVVYVIMGRGSVYNPFTFVAYGVPLILVISFIIKHLKFGCSVSGSNNSVK